MSRIKQVFSQLKQTKRKAFIPFLMAGDSGFDNTLALMDTLVENGADVIELGMAFSDPMADGVVIQKAHERAILAGANLKKLFHLVSRFRQKNDYTPIVLMGYLNPIEILGYQNFADALKQSGVDGVLIVDMPPEETNELHTALKSAAIDLIYLIAPTTSSHRLANIASSASGFVYFVSLKGVTGAGHIKPATVSQQLVKIKQAVSLPIGVGFGIDNAHTAKQLSQDSDAIIVGSAIVDLIAKNQTDTAKMKQVVGALAYELSQAINH